jgi:hypothetical protein
VRRQQEVYVAFDGELTRQLFERHYQRDWIDSVPVEVDALIAKHATGVLRQAAALGAKLKDLALSKDKAARTVANAASVLPVIRAHRARPVGCQPQ